jgi:hypothetical protein
MPVVTAEPITAYAHCAQQTEPGVRCEGYAQEQVAGFREITAFLYGDSGPSSDPFDAAVARLVERESIRIVFAREADRPCPHCGAPREVADQLRPQYQRLDQSDPDELLRRQRVGENAAVQSAGAAERQAVALEALVAQGAQAGQVEQLREVIERQQEQIDRLLAATAAEPGNGHGRPRKKTEG